MPVKKKNNKKKKPQIKLDVPDVPWAEQSSDMRVQTVQTLKAAFKKLELKNVEVYEVKEIQHPQGMAVEHLAAVGTCTEAQGKELQKFANLMDVFDKFEVDVSAVNVGSKMPFLVTAFGLDMKESLILEDRRGKIVFIQFWTPYNDRCNQAIAKLAEIGAKKHAEWAGKVSLLNIGCDTSLEKLKAKLDEKKWTDAVGLEHLFSGEEPPEEQENPDDVVCKYELETLPECMVIDGEGRLLKRGDLDDFDLVDYIDRLLKGEKDVEQETKVPPESWGSLTLEKRTTVLESLTTSLKSSEYFKDLLLVETECKVTPVFGLPRTEQDIMLVGKVDVRGEAAVASITRTFEDAGVKNVEQVVVVQSIVGPLSPAAQCYKCKNAFAAVDVRWHCAICASPVTMCTTCMNVESKAKKAERTDHPGYHPWYRIPAQAQAADLENVQYGMGTFAVAMTEHAQDEAKEGHSGSDCKDDNCDEAHGVVHDGVFCNGCDQGPISGMARWKCVSCDEFDYCDDCFQQYLNDKPAKKAKTKKGKKAAKAKESHSKAHIFIRIDDSETVQIAGEGDEGDEGDYDFEDDMDVELLKKAMAGGDVEGFDADDTEGLLAKIRALHTSSDGDAGVGMDDDETEGQGQEDASSAKLNALAEEAAQVPLPDDDDF